MKRVFNCFGRQGMALQQRPRHIRHPLVQFQPRQAGKKPNPAFRSRHVTFAGFINNHL